MAAELQHHAGLAQLVGRVEVASRVSVRTTLAPRADEQVRRRDAAPRGPDDHDPLARRR